MAPDTLKTRSVVAREKRPVQDRLTPTVLSRGNVLGLKTFSCRLKSTFVFSVVLMSFICTADGAKILFIPSLEYSHCNYMRGLAEELVRRGHSVTMYLCKEMDYRDCPGPNIDVITYKWTEYKTNMPFKKQMNKDIFEGQWKRLFDHMEIIKHFFCQMMENDMESIENLRRRRFDFAVIDGLFFSRCFYLVPYNLTIPYLSMASVIEELDSGQLIAPGLFPSKYSDYTNDMTFVQRVLNTLYFIVPHIAKFSKVPTDTFKLAPGLTSEDLEELYRKSELFLENGDVLMNYPKPVLPNYIQVGGLTTRPAKPLPPDLRTFFDGAKNGAIIVSFGSVFEDDSNVLTPILLSALSRLPQRVLLKASEDKDLGNIKTVTWLPLNDALAHPNTRLVVYHCGNNGHFESIYHGIPLVCLPIIADQFQIAKRVEHFKMGVKIDIRKLTAQILVDAIKKVLDDPAYTQRAKNFSRIFHSRRKTPAERAADAVEDVIQFGGQHLRSQHAPKNWFLLLHLDVWVFIFLVLQLIFVSIVWCTRRLLRQWLPDSSTSTFTIFMYISALLSAWVYLYL